MLIMCSDRAGQTHKQYPEKEAAIEFIIWHFIFTREKKAVISESEICYKRNGFFAVMVIKNSYIPLHYQFHILATLS